MVGASGDTKVQPLMSTVLPAGKKPLKSMGADEKLVLAITTAKL